VIFEAALPLCMLTGDNTGTALMECLAAGANDYIWKGSLNPTVAQAMEQSVTRLQDPDAPKGNPIRDNAILHSRGLQPHHLSLLADYAEADFPGFEDFAPTVGMSVDVLNSRFYRIRTILGLPDHDALVKLLKAARGYTGKMSCPPLSPF